MAQDGRKTDHKKREEIRKKAIERINAGESPENVIKEIGYHRSAVYAWLKRYKQCGENIGSLAYKKNHGPKGKLSPEHKKAIFKAITENAPDIHMSGICFWNRETLQGYIRQHFNISISISTVGRLMLEFGLSSRKPLAAAIAKDRKSIELWRKEEYPSINKEAKRSNAAIYYLDIADVRPGYTEAPVPAKKGPKKNTAHFNFRSIPRMLYVISTKGVTYFMSLTNWFLHNEFIDLLRRIASVENRNFYLIVYGTPVQGYKRRLKRLNDELCMEIKVFHIKPNKTRPPQSANN